MTRMVSVVLSALVFVASVAPGGAQPAAARKAAAPPEAEWRAVKDKTLQLSIDGRDDEVVKIYEGYVAKYPDFGEAHGMLGGAHEALSRNPKFVARRAEHMQKAATHYERAFQSWSGDGAWVAIRALLDIYGPPPLGLGRPERQRAVVLEGVKRFPAEPLAHTELIRMLALDDKPAEVDAAVRAARAAVARTAQAREDLASGLWRITSQEPVETVLGMRLADEALAVMEEYTNAQPKDLPGLRARVRVIREQVALSPPDRTTRLQADADRLEKEIERLSASSPRR